jgi:ceramide glucosyltransferase
MHEAFASLGLMFAAAASLYSSAAWFLLRRWIETPQRPASSPPPVTVLKPLCGAEAQLPDCLRSLARQSYPGLQIVFGVREASDPAIAVVEELRREFPVLDIELVVDGRLHGENLKASNLINMLARARHPILVISDSDVRVGPGYLDSVVAALTPATVGAVTCLYRGRAGSGLWSRLAALFINDWYFPAVLVSQALGDHSFTSGVTIALRRQTLEAIGGLNVVADHLADDWLIGEHVRRLGLKTVLCPFVVETDVAEEGFGAHANRELRWMRTIRTVAPVGYSFMGFSFALPVALLGLLLAWPSPWAWALGGLTLVGRSGIHWEQQRRATAPQAGYRLGYDWVLIPLRDSLLLAVWVAGFLGRAVTWRGRRYRVRSGGALSPLGG